MSPGAWLELPAALPFYESLIEYGELGAWQPADMLTLMAGECDLLMTGVPNAHGYQGLTQIGHAELRALGYDEAARGPFCLATPAVQVEYAARYFAGWRQRLGIVRWASAGHLWACNLAPAHLARVDGVVYSELATGPQYRANRWLDRNRDGVITCDELTDCLVAVSVPRCLARYELALASLATVRSEAETQPARTYAANVQAALVAERERV